MGPWVAQWWVAVSHFGRQSVNVILDPQSRRRRYLFHLGHRRRWNIAHCVRCYCLTYFPSSLSDRRHTIAQRERLEEAREDPKQGLRSL